MRVGGVELINGKIVELVIDSVATVPVFEAANAGEFIFSLDDKVLRFNSGEGFVPLNTTVSENPNLISSLGSNWLNGDLSFNPVPFNDLAGISGLSGNDSLFTVIDQISVLIANVSDITLSDISIPDGLPNMAVVAQVAGDLIIVPIEEVLAGSTISLNFDNLSGFDITNVTEGNIIAFNENGDLTSRTAHYRYENLTPSDAHLITHSLGEQYCSVFCIDPQTNKVITPTEIEFISSDQLVINFTIDQKLVALITNMPRFPAA